MIKKLVLVNFLLFSVYSFSQSSNASPYSFFGIGEQAKIKSVEEIAMGGIGGALNSEYHLSFTNPASYGALRWTTYVFSGATRALTINDGNDKQTSSATSLTYIAMGIPIRTNQGLAFGLQLNTAVGYTLVDQTFEDIDGEETLVEKTILSGDGGTNRVFIGYGYHFPFNLNIGFEAAYIFGGITNDVFSRRIGVQLATRYETVSYVKGFSYKFGAHYTKDLKNDLKLKVGLSATLGNTLTERGDEYISALINLPGGGPIVERDTISNYKATVDIPIKPVISVGVGKDNNWFIGAEYTFQNALTFDGGLYDDITTVDYTNSSTISMGGFYLPKMNSIKTYWDRVTYRAGFNYKKLGLVVNDTDINEYGISFGVSLPLGLRISNANLGFEFGKRGTQKNNLIEENFYNFRLSLSLNSKWFKKQKIY